MRILVGISAIVATVVLTTLLIFREDIGYYWELWRVNRVGARFYETYEHIERDVDFGAGEVRLDLYRPDEGDGHPVLIFMHGGGWDSYQKEFFAPVAMKLLPQKMVVVIPDYTLYPAAGYEQMAQETAAAVAWTFEHISRYGGDPEAVVLSGHSAGGHLAGLVAFDDSWLSERGHSPAQLCAFVGMSGVYDIPIQMAFERSYDREAPVMQAVMGGEENFERASPSQYVNGNELPVLLLHGEEDETVPLSISEHLYQLLEDAGSAVSLQVYPEKGHTDFLLEALTNDEAPILQDIGTVIRSCTSTVLTINPPSRKGVP